MQKTGQGKAGAINGAAISLQRTGPTRESTLKSSRTGGSVKARIAENELQQRMQNLKLLITDVDGVLTDGNAYYGSEGLLFKQFSMRDGFGFVMAQAAGLEIAVITGDPAPAVKHRLAKFKITRIKGGHFRKTGFFEELLDETGVREDEAAYIGDDLFDIPVLKRVGLAVAPSDAHPQVIESVHMVTDLPGGGGVVRETVEAIIHAMGRWDEVLKNIEEDKGGGIKT
jgi:3-deoxy-D-manno-octulosonate 8-phosphate phosphatase (KDO 8-P phosphatase)